MSTAGSDAPATSPAPRAPLRLGAGSAAQAFARFAPLVILAVLLVFATASNGSFWEIGNLRNILTLSAPIALVAFGMTFVIIGGSYDLSVGATFAMGGVVYADLSNQMSLPLAAVVVIAVACVLGWTNGFLVSKVRVDPFIGTIGTGAAILGLVYIYCHSNPIYSEAVGFRGLGFGKPLLGLTWPVWIALAVMLSSGFVLARTVFGRFVFATGGNSEAARLASIPVARVRIATFVLVAALAAFAGMITASQLNIGQPTLGTTVPLDAFAIVIIGGSSVYGGSGAIWRTTIGIFILAVLTNIVNTQAWPSSYEEVAKGLVLVSAVALDAVRRRAG